MEDKAVRSAVVAGGAVALLQLLYLAVTTEHGCNFAAGSRVACTYANVQVVAVCLPVAIAAIYWSFSSLGREGALLSTLVTMLGLLWFMNATVEPGWGTSDPAATAFPVVAAAYAWGCMRLGGRLVTARR